MRIAVLGATGRVGHLIAEQALGRDHEVISLGIRKELAEKAAPDAIALAGGATVFHAPDLRVGDVSATRRSIPLADYPRPVLPPHASRATVAALILDEAERPARGARILVPVAGA